MGVFESYSQYYDLLYRDKDYAAEAKFVLDLIAKHAPKAAGILELGCGTGAHARLFATEKFTVHGVDFSSEMLSVAKRKATEMSPDIGGRLLFQEGDIRTFRTDGRFDVVLSLFHVISYQTSNEDLLAALRTAEAHLSKDGVFIFDYWFGPAVLTDRPTVRVKRMESENVAVTRIAEPDIDAEKSCVKVDYTVFVRDKNTDTTERLHESHLMRYLFLTEIELLAKSVGLRVIESGEWLTGKSPGFDTWGVCTVLGR